MSDRWRFTGEEARRRAEEFAAAYDGWNHVVTRVESDPSGNWYVVFRKEIVGVVCRFKCEVSRLAQEVAVRGTVSKMIDRELFEAWRRRKGYCDD